MKRSIIALICSIVSAGILWAQTQTPQTSTPAPTTTQKPAATTTQPGAPKTSTGKTSATTTKPVAPKTATSKTAAPAASKTATSSTTTGKPATATTAKSAAPPTTTPKTASTAASKTTVSKPATAAAWITTGSGLKYQDVVVGKGPAPKAGDDLLVNYTGRFPNGKVFDSSLGPGRGPFELHLGRGEVIKGWDEALSTMHVGGKRKLIIPPDLAYGPRGYPGVIPPNSTLTFDVELLRIK
jgi:peptidylprolyl isomerase